MSETVSLKQHYDALRDADERLRISDQLFHDEREKRYSERFSAQEQAIRVADERLREYKEQANQLRSTFVNRTEYDLMREQVNRVMLFAGEERGNKEGSRTTWGTVIVLISLAVSIISAVGIRLIWH